METRVTIKGEDFRYREFERGDTGVVDGYCRGGDDRPYAIVILDKNRKFVMVDIMLLEQIWI